MEHYEIIRKRREELELTQKEVADKLFIRHNTYSQYETGKRKIDSETIFRIIEILELDPSSFQKGYCKRTLLPPNIDFLTKVYNRKRFYEELEKNEHPFRFSLHVRNLKYIDDTYGCEETNRLLQKVAEALKHTCKKCKNCFIGRIGGVYFGILLKEVNKEKFIKILLSNLKIIHSEIDFTITDL